MFFLFALHCILRTHFTYAQSTQESNQDNQLCHNSENCRSLSDIVWSCFVVVFTCTWVAVHTNIPAEDEGKGWRFLRRVGIFVIALIAPETIIYWAMCQRAVAAKLANQYKDHGWTLTHGFFAVMGGFMLYKGDKPDRIILPHKLDKYIISRQIDVTEGELQDRSKGDILTKGFVLLQTSWFILQLAARAINKLPISELEIATLAFAVFNFVTYGLWWYKPQDVEFPLPVRKTPSGPNRGSIDKAYVIAGTSGSIADETGMAHLIPHPVENQTPGELLRSAFRPPEKSFYYEIQGDGWWMALIKLAFAPLFGGVAAVGDKRVPTFYNAMDIYDDVDMTVGHMSFGLAALFGAIHCIAWSFHFSSSTEQTLWHVASVVITVAPLLLIFLGWFGWSDTKEVPLIRPMMVVLTVLYTIARVILLVLPLMLLRSLASGIYDTVHWTTFIPHI